MTTLLQLSLGDSYVAWAVSTLLQATTVLAIAWVLASLLARQNAAARYAIWLVALTLLLLSPLTAYLAVSSGVSLVELSLPQESFDERARDPANVAPSPTQASPPPVASYSDEFSWHPSLSEQALAPPQGSYSDEFSWHPSLSEQALAPPQGYSTNGPVPTPAFSGGETPAIPVPSSWSPAACLRAGTSIVSVLWACGIGCLSVRLAWRARRSSRLLRDTRQLEIPATENLVRDICRGMGVRRTPELRIWASPGANLAPITVGVFRPKIVLSLAIFGSLPADRLRDVLVHECAARPPA